LKFLYLHQLNKKTTFLFSLLLLIGISIFYLLEFAVKKLRSQTYVKNWDLLMGLQFGHNILICFLFNQSRWNLSAYFLRLFFMRNFGICLQPTFHQLHDAQVRNPSIFCFNKGLAGNLDNSTKSLVYCVTTVMWRTFINFQVFNISSDLASHSGCVKCKLSFI
jgi:hypothetical protein